MSYATRAPGSPGIGAKANGFGRRHGICSLTIDIHKAAS